LSDPARFRRAIAWMAAILLLVHAAIAAIEMAHSGRDLPDFVRYYEIATARGRPYLDYQVEHPPVTVLIFKMIAAFTHDRHAFAFALVALNLCADIVIVAALWRAWGPRAVVFYAAAVWPMLAIVMDRVDLLSTAAATLGVALWWRRRPGASGLAFSFGVGSKLWPLPLSAILLADRDAPRRRLGAVALATGCAAIAIAWLTIARFDGLWQVLTFRSAHGWQIEGMVGSILRLFGDSSLRFESGSWRIGAIPSSTAIALFLLATPLAAAASASGARAGRVGTGWIGSIGLLLLCSPLFSAQYIIWLAPGAAIAWLEGEKVAAGLVAASVLLTGVFMRNYSLVLAGAAPAVRLVIVRNLVLCAAVWWALKELKTPAPPPGETTGPSPGRRLPA
jgi:hypothetical protein